MDFRKPDLTAEQWAENDARVREQELAERAEERRKRIERACIPLDYKDARPSEKAVSDWAREPSKGLLIQGMVGRGKTYNACAALLIALDAGFSVRFATFDDLLRECKATYNSYSTEQAVIGKYASVGMLCIDDMGKERVTEWSLPIIFTIINKRSMNRRPTIITTQYSGKQLIERMTVNGDSETARAIISRLFEYERITLEGKDWRRVE